MRGDTIHFQMSTSKPFTSHWATKVTEESIAWKKNPKPMFVYTQNVRPTNFYVENDQIWLIILWKRKNYLKHKCSYDDNESAMRITKHNTHNTRKHLRTRSMLMLRLSICTIEWVSVELKRQTVGRWVNVRSHHCWIIRVRLLLSPYLWTGNRSTECGLCWTSNWNEFFWS